MNKLPLFPKDFILVAIGQIISIFGNQILRYALPLYLLQKTGSSALFGTILAISFIPMLLLYPIGGMIADRVNKRNIMVILDFSTAILIFLFYLLAGSLSMVPLIAVTMMLLYGIQGAYQPAVQASVPILVNTEHIMEANSVVNLISSLASMIGPVLGGILFSLVGLTPILYVSIGCFLASAVLEIFIHIPYEKKPANGNLIVTGFTDIKESFIFLFKEQPILWKVSLIYASTSLFLTSLVVISFPVLITQHLGFMPDTANRLYGYAQGIIAIGAVAGGLLTGVLAKKLTSKATPYILIGCALSTLSGGIALQLLTEPLVVYGALVIGAGLLVALSTLIQIQIMSYVQLLTPKDLTGKVISCVICLCMCSNPVGQFIYGMIFEQIETGTYLPFYIAGIFVIGMAITTRHIFQDIDSLMIERAKDEITGIKLTELAVLPEL